MYHALRQRFNSSAHSLAILLFGKFVLLTQADQQHAARFNTVKLVQNQA